MIERIKAIGGEIQAEHALIFQRLGWYVASQSSLMTAYAINLSSPFTNCTFLGTLYFVGLTMSAIALFAICAAVLVQWQLVRRQGKLFKKTPPDSEKELFETYREMACAGRTTGYTTHIVAMIGPIVIPLLFVYAWREIPKCTTEREVAPTLATRPSL